MRTLSEKEWISNRESKAESKGRPVKICQNRCLKSSILLRKIKRKRSKTSEIIKKIRKIV